MKHYPSYYENNRKVQAACSCGWQAVGKFATEGGASQAFAAHMYAQGFRTSAEVKAATT